ncbi:uncharacterized protein A1O5_01774 [Cladophialophora psammophila CBS 110553]|uniref:3-oxoacyl-[acyl-carrier protein] reductase n=1 Tax=Cladophialophora psammophila CBS 110553 TaxID=1182543 RepID=W9X4F0_9EURO|nr:uncharacterized protein A1O5_01774 [Cladophialophora psammophila CBS 110553]EXJ75078.1 hypothetical protein A1O5_01774 [Cladophialophora psammophila CBS 110553]
MSATMKNVLVILGVGGMGKACAHRLAAGRSVFIADYSKENLDATAEALRAEGRLVHTSIVDIADYESVSKFADSAAAEGRIETIVHTAGVSPIAGDPKTIYAIDLLGTANVIDGFYRHATPGTTLTCIASIAAQETALSGHITPDLEKHLATASREKLLDHPDLAPDSLRYESSYGISKRGNQLRVEIASQQWGRRGARINTVSPGVIATPMAQKEASSAGGNQTFLENMIVTAGLRRIGTATEIVNAVAFLASSEASFINGADLRVDGGQAGWMRWHSKRI